MTARDIAREKYLTGGPDTFYSDLAAHYEHGHVIDEPDCFLLWRTVPLDWPLERMKDCRQSVPRGTCAWLWMISGDWQKAVTKGLEVTPWVEWAAFERRGRPKLLWIADILRVPDSGIS